MARAVRPSASTARIAAAWQDTRGAAPTQADVDALYALFVPKNETVAARYAALVPGTVETMAALRARGLKIGSTTGYTRSIMAHVLPVAAAQGFSPDNLVCSDDLPEGRPGPGGMLRCCADLGVDSPRALIKVDDTVPGILEGVSAGALTVGVALSGNAVGLSVEALAALPAAEVESLREKAGSILLKSRSRPRHRHHRRPAGPAFMAGSLSASSSKRRFVCRSGHINLHWNKKGSL